MNKELVSDELWRIVELLLPTEPRDADHSTIEMPAPEQFRKMEPPRIA